MRLRLSFALLLGIAVALGCSESPTNVPDSSEAGIAAAKGGKKGGNNAVSLDLVEYKVVRLPAGVDPRIWDEGEGTEEQLPSEYVDGLLLGPDADPYAIPQWNWLYVHIVSATPLSTIMANVVLDRVRDGEWTRGEEYIHFIGAIHGHVNDDFSLSDSDNDLNYAGPWDELNDNVYEYRGYMHRPWIGQVDVDWNDNRIQYPDVYGYPGNRPGSHEPDPFVFLLGTRLADGSTGGGPGDLPDIPGSADPLEYRTAKYAGPDPEKLIYTRVSDLTYETRKVRGKQKTYANWTVAFPSIDFTTSPVDRNTIDETGKNVISTVFFTTYVGGVAVQSGFTSSTSADVDYAADFSIQVEPGSDIEFHIHSVIAKHKSGFTESWDPNPAVNDLETIFPKR